MSGQQYKLQLLFTENYWPNATQWAFDVLIDNVLAADEFDVAAEQGDLPGSGTPPRANRPTRGAVITETFVAAGSVLEIKMTEGTSAGDDNPFINAFTLA